MKNWIPAPLLGRALVLCGAAIAVFHPFGRIVPAGDLRGPEAGIETSVPGVVNRFSSAADYSKRHGGSALVVMSGGEVVFEDYAGEGAPERPHRLASGTKSFWGALAMAAVEDGLFTLDDVVADTLTEWRDDPDKSRIRVRHLLDFTSGLDPAVELLRGNPKSDDKFKLVLEVPSVSAPGDSFAYGPSHLFAFGAFLQRKLQAAGRSGDPLLYLKERILEPIGMRLGHWRKDAAGNPIMPAGAYVAPREWVKFGEFLNKKGTWSGRQIVDSALLTQVFEGSRANPEYGLTLWLHKDASAGQDRNAADSKASRRAAGSDGGPIYRDGPAGLAMAAGSGKQRLYIIPSMDMVIVRQGESKGTGWSDTEFLALVLPGTPRAGLGDSAAAGPSSSDWQAACQADIERFCQSAHGDRRRLRRCLRGHKHELSAACIAAAKAARRDSD